MMTSKNQTQSWEYDVVGNRTQQVCGNQTTTYTNDVNDRLTREVLLDSSDSAKNRCMVYAFGTGSMETRLRTRTRYRGTSAVTANREQVVSYAYNRQNRLSVATTSDYNTSNVRVNYEEVFNYYDPHGNLQIKYQSFSPDTDTTWDVRTQYRYVNDLHSLSGYCQAMREETRNYLDGSKLLSIASWTLGHERHLQLTTPCLNGVAQPASAHTDFFTHDAHGSTRALTDTSGNVTQRYDYDAFGNAVGFVPGEALTQFLYCGELFDTLSAPLVMGDEAIERFVRTKTSWIKKQVAKFENQPRQSEREYVSGETLYVWGKPYYLQTLPSTEQGALFSDEPQLLTIALWQGERTLREVSEKLSPTLVPPQKDSDSKPKRVRGVRKIPKNLKNILTSNLRSVKN